MTTDASTTAAADGLDGVPPPGSPVNISAPIAMPTLIAAMLDSGKGTSDLIFSAIVQPGLASPS